MTTYTFRFHSRAAEFGNGFTTVIYDRKIRYNEIHDMTLPEALSYLHEFVNKVEDGPAMVEVTCTSKPVPRGYHKAVTWMEKRQ